MKLLPNSSSRTTSPKRARRVAILGVGMGLGMAVVVATTGFVPADAQEVASGDLASADLSAALPVRNQPGAPWSARPASTHLSWCRPRLTDSRLYTSRKAPRRSTRMGSSCRPSPASRTEKIINASKAVVTAYKALGGTVPKVVAMIKKYAVNESSLTTAQISAVLTFTKAVGSAIFSALGIGSCSALLTA